MASDKDGQFKFCAECSIKFHRKPRLGDSDWNTRKFCSPECSRDSQKRRFKIGRGKPRGPR